MKKLYTKRGSHIYQLNHTEDRGGVVHTITNGMSLRNITDSDLKSKMIGVTEDHLSRFSTTFTVPCIIPDCVELIDMLETARLILKDYNILPLVINSALQANAVEYPSVGIITHMSYKVSNASGVSEIDVFVKGAIYLPNMDVYFKGYEPTDLQITAFINSDQSLYFAAQSKPKHSGAIELTPTIRVK